MKFLHIEETRTPEVALEGILGLDDKSFKSMVSSIANYMPDMRNMLASPAEKLSGLKEVSSSVMNSLSGMFSSSALTTVEFRAYERVKISTPESFTGNLHDYSEFLKSSWNFLMYQVIPQVDVFYGFLATFASNKEAKISLVDTTKIYKAIEAEYKSLQKESESYFGKVKHNAASSTLGVCFGDFEQFRQTQETTRQLCKELSPKQADKVCKQINKIVTVLDVIIEDAKAKNYEKASFEAVKSLAVGIYALAEALEFYSVTYYRITELGSVMAANKEVVNKL